jgi:hypothetical protein
MKKSISILALAVLGLTFGATISRADEPVRTSYGGSVETFATPGTFTDDTLALDASASHETTARDSFSIQDRGFSGHFDWFDRAHRGSVTTTPIPPCRNLLRFSYYFAAAWA